MVDVWFICDCMWYGTMAVNRNGIWCTGDKWNSNTSISFARNMVLLHSEIHNLQCIDIVSINYKTEDAIKRFEMGHTGVTAIKIILSK